MLSVLKFQFWRFREASELQGVAWWTAKFYYDDVHATLIDGNIAANEEIMLANKHFSSFIDEYIDKDRLDEDKLQCRLTDLKQRLERLEQSTSNAKATLLGASSIVVTRTLIKDLEKDIQSLYDLERSTSNLYTEVNSLQLAIQRGIAAVSRSTPFNPSSRKYSTKDLDRSWKKEIDKALQRKRLRDAGIYNEDGLYGGDQGSPLASFDSGDQGIRDLLHKHFPDMTEEEMRDYLQKLNDEGCGYVALINAFLENYTGTAAEFEAEFGFPLYVERKGKLEYNFDALLVDLYAETDNHNSFFGRDYIKDEDASATDGKGTSHQDREYRFKKYLKAHNMNVNFELGTFANANTFNIYKRNETMMITVNPIILENKAGKVVDNRRGSHSMTVTGTTKDGRLIVSSWGKKFYVNPGRFGSNDNTSYQLVEFK